MNDGYENQAARAEPAVVVKSPSTKLKKSAMLFRIVGPHQHQAVLEGRVFWCERETTTANGGLSIRWSAFEGKTLLKSDCRTLNDAKKLCRAAVVGAY